MNKNKYRFRPTPGEARTILALEVLAVSLGFLGTAALLLWGAYTLSSLILT